MQLTAEPLILYLQLFNPISVSLLTLAVCYMAILVMVKLWGKAGLYIYTTVALLACNIQVLKAVFFTGYVEPVALGTIVYASIFLSSDTITELYGAKSARKSVLLSFAASILLLLLMILALGLKPLDIAADSPHLHFNQAHQALALIFTPNLAIITASLTAYVISQYTDIYIFSTLRRLTNRAHLWIRTLVSVSTAAIFDSLIFNILAWMVFSSNPISWHSLFFTYVFGAYILQLIVATLNIPVLYLLLKIVKR